MSATTNTAIPSAAAPVSARKLGVFTLAMMNFTAVVSLRGLPAEAEYGLGSIFYYVFAAVFFLIPVSLVAAELATGWPQKGGVFRWVGEAFGPRWGFVAIFLQWVESTIWFPCTLPLARRVTTSRRAARKAVSLMHPFGRRTCTVDTAPLFQAPLFT
ncbi:MAG TPA: amino acid permease, partial [Acetobacteraceae bacterium]|nr:amino acid permease [Acetobacteraceae bacterium]